MKQFELLLFSAAIATLLPSLPTTAAGGTPGVEDIVRKANCAAYYQGEDGRAEVSMRITDAQGRERRRELTVLRRTTDRTAGATAARCRNTMSICAAPRI